jgi:RNA polymerase sigma-70 factor (ECF subfamily)
LRTGAPAVINEALGRARKRARRAQVMQLHPGSEPADYDYPTEATMDPGPSDSPENGALRAETRQLLEKSIDALPDAFRTVFVLRAVQEMNSEEVAASLGIPEARWPRNSKRSPPTSLAPAAACCKSRCSTWR